MSRPTIPPQLPLLHRLQHRHHHCPTAACPCTNRSASSHLPSSAKTSTLPETLSPSSPLPSVSSALASAGPPDAASRTSDNARSHCPPAAHASSAARHVAGDGSSSPLAHIVSTVARAVSAALAADCTAETASAVGVAVKSRPGESAIAVAPDDDCCSDVLPVVGGVSGSFPNSGGACDGGRASSVAPGIPARGGCARCVGVGSDHGSNT